MSDPATFVLDKRLATDTIRAGESELSLLLWLNDRRYPWLLLVPKRSALSEIYELAPADRVELLDESCQVARTLSETFGAFKVNVGALGNVVRQLHVHHVARFENDPAWPGPVWGHSPREPYEPGGVAERTRLLAQSTLASRFSLVG